MPLTDTQARKAQPSERDYKLADAGGLYLFVTTKGAKSWRMKYRFAGREKRLTFGLYPDVSLAEARDRRDAARRQLREHRDPTVEEHKRKMAAHAAAGATFEKVSRDWFELQKPRWVPRYAKKIIRALERDIFPEIGRLPVIDVDGPMIIRALRKVEARGSIASAKDIRTYVEHVFAYAISESLVPSNPASSIQKALKPIIGRTQHPALTDVDQLIGLQRTIDVCTSNPVTKLASRFLALTAVRPGVQQAAEWTEIEGIDWADYDAPAPLAIWRIPAEKMKLELRLKAEDIFSHDVPLPPEAVAVLRALHRLTGRCRWLFPSTRSTARQMSENALQVLYIREGYRGRHVPHGWRAAFSTIMNDIARRQGRESDRPIIDMMLAHKPKGLSGSEFAYNRALHADRRRELAVEWAGMITRSLPEPNDLIDGQER